MRPHDWYPDTDPKALEVFIDLQRKMSPSEKIAGVFAMNEMLRRITEAHERRSTQACDRERIVGRVHALCRGIHVLV